MKREKVLGVDFGGVISDRVADNSDTSFFAGRFLETPMVDGAMDALFRLVNGPFEGRVHVISKAGPKIQERTRLWMNHHQFTDRTGISEANVHFCRERRDKAPICKRLAVTHFVDDRLDVLGYLETVPVKLLFCARIGDTRDHPAPLPTGITRVIGWAEAEAALTS
ncbi:MAG: hypothetical protein FP825_05595 [Hyphomonas sp.]|uniref:hypothetical protein n=1 Tax=Hyphomonas sp. TaxID=87 RepID=UPI0018035328|nr:hypothetical protein [Hyphomonas sp.]MBA3067942.1 hypothetical protein [Hyphomonas sp.]MBU3919570.1 hypothetical protein [Alphaproteobacteria bacterium]MBU4061280.1 hypothetical protein [Alphaproteobacteria bacterium]MBU4162533.1 hypothetical protein [Alphaproteobacteria bacterium]